MPRTALIANDTVAGPHGPIPVRRYSPLPDTPASAVPIVWIHGGAFVKGGLDQPESHSVALALARAGFPVITVDYRLATGLRIPRPAPAVRYPIPFDDVVAVVEATQRDHPGGVILGGASAGACLAAAAVLRLAAAGKPAPLGSFFAYGTFHAALPTRSRQLRARVTGPRRFTHTPSTISLMNLNYAGTRAALRDPFAFPGGHPLGAFPPSLFIDADHDVLRASGSRFAEEVAATGIHTQYHLMHGTDHAFLNRPNDPAFAPAIALIVDWASGITAHRN